MTTGTFPSEVIAAAIASRRKWDIPASVTLAQWAVESAWGTRMPRGSDNPFGIKAVHDQPSVAERTREVIHGKNVIVTASFRVFASLAQAFDLHAELLATGAPYAHARLWRHDAKAFALALTGVYATDPHYGPTLISVMDAHALYHFDTDAPPAAANKAAVVTLNRPSAPSAAAAHQVAASPAPARPVAAPAVPWWRRLFTREAA